jgi:hypothetical protein
MRGTTTVMNVGRDGVGARREEGGITWVVGHGSGGVIGGASAGGKGWRWRSKLARGLWGFVR